ncbi:BlaI/MecI/CopY family transcriptional regulator [Paenibacillus spongiae]|uniref:BlaI/MecI/CopY family transcriptional regulator n=1 Tax=Paenibacillus spongiae TaxID=2909671 RepID=A0ABY5S9S0_9BACL|nr:BlaI/MecI/CopY family transcriptional regulator [Paenibacillus spongiae]UVI30484.1 BlaI/MecI/CopY family transcriptional regulator [Paenibacillus spongiae]
MNFEQSHQAFLDRHLASRAGERRGRLLRGHNYAEKLLLQNVWWPMFGNLEHLHPEYEIYDWNRKSQFLDFAFLPPFGRFGIECDGFQSHVKDMDRERFSYALNRDTFLTGMGWKMIHFSFDDVQNRPEVCRMLLKLVLSPYLIRDKTASSISPSERDVLRLAWSLGKPLRPKDVIDRYQVNYRTAHKWLQGLIDKGLLRSTSTGKYSCYYEVREIAESLL